MIANEGSESDSESDHGSCLSGSSDIPDLTPGYHPTAGDLLAVRFLFLRRLPVELADNIINTAEYWPKIEVLSGTVLKVQATLSNGIPNDASWCYVITPPIPARLGEGTVSDDVELHSKVQKVRFWTLGRDQGWGGDVGDQGTYQGSFTWLEAAIIRPSEFAHDTPWIFDVAREPVEILDAYEHEYPGTGFVEAEVDGEKRWLVQRNVTASGTVTPHEIIWQNGIQENRETDISKGKGSGEGFITALRPGDRIAVIARAMCPGWINNVYGVAVEIFYSM